jgi:type I restriction enzyme S subunit
MKWKQYCLADIIHIKHGYAFKGEFFSEEPTDDILLTPGNFSIGGGFKTNKLKYYNGEFPVDYILDENDVIVTMTDLSKEADTLGFTARVPSWYGKRFLHNQRIGLLSLKSNEFDLNYLYWLMRTYSYQRFVANGATGATVKHTSPTKICSYTFTAPENKDAQRKIASILSAYDDLIENNLKRIKLLEEKAFVTYKGIVSSEKLEAVQLKDVAVVNESTLKTNSNIDTLLYVDIASVSTGSIDNKTEYDLKEAPGRAKRILKHEDIIWSCVRPNRKSYSFVWKPEENLIASTGFAVITSKEIPATFLYQQTIANEFVNYLENHAKGATYPAVTATDFAEALINIPPASIMKEYHEAVYPCFELKSILQKQNTKLREARDILLPRLMNGQIEVS